MIKLERLPYQIKRTILTSSPSGTYYEHELVDERNGRIIFAAITTSPIAPKQLRKYQAVRNTESGFKDLA